MESNASQEVHWNPGAIPGLQHALPGMFGLLPGESVKDYVVMLMAYNLYNFFS